MAGVTCASSSGGYPSVPFRLWYSSMTSSAVAPDISSIMEKGAEKSWERSGNVLKSGQGFWVGKLLIGQGFWVGKLLIGQEL